MVPSLLPKVFNYYIIILNYQIRPQRAIEDFHLLKGDSMKRLYKFSDLPVGLFPRLISKLLREIQVNISALWSNGILGKTTLGGEDEAIFFVEHNFPEVQSYWNKSEEVIYYYFK